MLVLYCDRIGIWSVGFCGGGNPENRRKPLQQSENQKQTQPTLLGGERYHYCANL